MWVYIACIASVVASTSAVQVRHNATYQVTVHGNITYAQGLVCTDRTYTRCSAFNLTLDAYVPVPTGDVDASPLSPAIVLSHGGGNSGGAKGTTYTPFVQHVA